MRVIEVARAADVNTDTVRYYTRLGLLRPGRDPDNGYRRYGAGDLQRLRFVRRARQLGFSLQEIAAILREADDHNSPCPLVRELFEHKLADVERQLAELTETRNRMRQAMAAWQEMPDGIPDGHTICRLIEHWERPQAAKEGS